MSVLQSFITTRLLRGEKISAAEWDQLEPIWLLHVAAFDVPIPQRCRRRFRTDAILLAFANTGRHGNPLTVSEQSRLLPYGQMAYTILKSRFKSR